MQTAESLQAGTSERQQVEYRLSAVPFILLSQATQAPKPAYWVASFKKADSFQFKSDWFPCSLGPLCHLFYLIEITSSNI